MGGGTRWGGVGCLHTNMTAVLTVCMYHVLADLFPCARWRDLGHMLQGVFTNFVSF